MIKLLVAVWLLSWCAAVGFIVAAIFTRELHHLTAALALGITGFLTAMSAGAGMEHRNRSR